MTVDILGMIHAADSLVRVRTIRPGRTIELLEATLCVDGIDVVRATAWRLSRQDTAQVAGGVARGLPSPDSLAPDLHGLWAGGYYAAQEVRRVPGGQPGEGQAWVRSPIPLLDGVATSRLASLVLLADTANGLVTRADPDAWSFPNIDLSLHVFRDPVGEWLGLDTEVFFGGSGVGVTSTMLHDVAGPLGRAEQILTVRKVTHSRPSVVAAPRG